MVFRLFEYVQAMGGFAQREAAPLKEAASDRLAASYASSCFSTTGLIISTGLEPKMGPACQVLSRQKC